MTYVKLMRVHHYIKNLLIFAALLCSGQLFIGEKLLAGAEGFVVFCGVSSAVYIINDIRDRERDRRHPTKCRRPIASGAVSVRAAGCLAGALLAFAFLLQGLFLDRCSGVLLLLYLALNLAYSMGAKEIPLVDISILVSGFVLRIVYGAIITDITVSDWLYLTVIAISFYFALGKRRNELMRMDGHETRPVLRAYLAPFLDKAMYMCLTLANAFYALWAMDRSAEEGANRLIFTVPIVLLITMKYSMNVEGDSDGDPVEVLLHDRVLFALCAGYLLVMLCILNL